MNYQYRVVYQHEGIPRHRRDFATLAAAQRLVRFLRRSPEKGGWDLHYQCQHGDGREEPDICEVSPEWRYRDPELTVLQLLRREVGPWEEIE
jgi:hypothetical protein